MIFTNILNTDRGYNNKKFRDERFRIEEITISN